MNSEINKWLKEREDIYGKLISEDVFTRQLIEASEVIRESFLKGGKLLIFGNGGSAAEAQHFAAELTGRFEKKREGLPAIALTTDTSFITAQANDDSFATIFSRQIEALGNKGDVVFGMTTSDAVGEHSANILKGFEISRNKGLVTIGLFSAKTKELLPLVDIAIIVQNQQTDIIQEIHLAMIHMLCRLIERQY